MRPLFSRQQELSNLDYYFQDGWKTGAQTNQSFWKLKNIFWWSKVSHIIIKGWNFMIKSFSGQVVFCFAILRAIPAYVGGNWLSQYSILGHIDIILLFSFFLSLYTARPSCNCTLQVAGWKSTRPTLHRGHPVNLRIWRMMKHTYLASSLQMTLEKVCSDTEIFLVASRDRTWDL